MRTSKLVATIKNGNNFPSRISFLILLSVLFAQNTDFLPFERSDIDLRYLHSSGLLDKVDISQLPINNKNLSPYFQELPNFQTPLASAYLDQENIVRFGAYPIIEYRNKLLVHLRSLVEITLGKNLSIKNTMLLDKSLVDQSEYIGKEWRGFVGYTEEAYLRFQKKKKIGYTLQVGRFFSFWGPGRTGQLLQSFVARPLDQIQANIKYKNWSFTWKASQLDAMGEINRFLSAHRVTYKSKWFRLSLNEAILYGGATKNFELAYLNPFIIYTGEQINGPALNANTMLSIDGRIRFSSSSFYFEFLIDDYQADAEEVNDLEPNELGMILGVDFTAERFYLGFELVGITNRTYKTTLDYEWYTHRNIPIGYGDGSDLWRANIFSRYYFSQHWQFDIEMDYLVRGEGEMFKTWDTPWEDDDITMETGYEESFPTGILEKHLSMSISAFRIFENNKWVSVELKYISTDNVDHISNINADDFEVSFGLSWLFLKKVEIG